MTPKFSTVEAHLLWAFFALVIQFPIAAIILLVVPDRTVVGIIVFFLLGLHLAWRVLLLGTDFGYAMAAGKAKENGQNGPDDTGDNRSHS